MDVLEVGGGRHFPDGVAVVIGGSGAIGAAICTRLAEHDTDVALTYHSNEEAAREVAAEVEGLGKQCLYQALDTTDPAQISAFFDTVAGRFERVHTLVLAIGADISMPYVSQVEAPEWDRTIAADLTGTFHCIQSALPLLRQSGGSIVAITSAGLNRHPQLDILSTAPKAGVEALLRGVAREEGRYGVRANSVAPGVIDAGLFPRIAERVGQGYVDAAKRNTALRRFGTVADTANATVFLASSSANFISGHRLVVDGGYTV